MPRAAFRFYEELNDFLPSSRRKVAFEHQWSGNASVKDLIEGLGVPHTEVEIILANGRSVEFGYRPREGDQVSVYPVFETLDVTPLLRLRPGPLRVVRFVLDGHLGRLAGYLRLLGFDTIWRADAADPELARVSQDEQRILLTRDRQLLKRAGVSRGRWIRSTNPLTQAREVLDRFDLRRAAAPFTRCMACNGLLRPASLEEVRARLLPGTIRGHSRYQACESCPRVYWKGSHHARLEALVDEFMGPPPSRRPV
jgi:hypothetical protein